MNGDGVVLLEPLAGRARRGSTARTGRNGSRCLIRALRMSFMSARRGSATIERLPSARGPNSIRPWNQPTTSPAAIRSATCGEERVVVEPLAPRGPAARERRRALLVGVLRARCRRAPSRSRAACRAPGSRRSSAAPTAVPGVARRRLDVELLERRLGPDPAVRDGVQRDAAGEAEVREPRALRRAASTRWRYDLLEHRLQRRGDVLVALRQLGVAARAPGRARSSSRSEKMRADRRRALVPGHVDAFACRA